MSGAGVRGGSGAGGGGGKGGGSSILAGAVGGGSGLAPEVEEYDEFTARHGPTGERGGRGPECRA